MSVTINGTNGVTYNDGSLQPSAPVGKNKIINGDMRVDQRDGTATINATGVTYNVDRWLGRGVGSAGVFTLAQDTTSPANFTNSLKATVTTADSSIASGSSYRIQQMVEGYNMADLNWGTSDAQSVSLSFWVRSSQTGTFGGSVGNGDFNRFNVFSYTISSANTWEYKTVTIAGDTSGTWVTNNTLGLRLNFSLGAGSTLLASAGSWGSSTKEGVTGQTNVIATNSATFYVTGVQLEANTTATPFENLQYGTQLELCQRYYQQYGSSSVTPIGAGVWFTTTQVLGLLTFPVIMRTAPTITTTGTGWIKAYRDGSSTATGSGFFDSIGNHSARFNMSGWDVAGTAGMGAYLQLVADKYIFISAEL
nr:hypothetical protein [uncultured bacterium]